MSTHSYIPPLFNYLFFYLFLYITSPFSLFFFFNDTATTEIYTLSLHDALPIFTRLALRHSRQHDAHDHRGHHRRRDRKSTRLNSSHLVISYAVFCLKKKKKTQSVLLLTYDDDVRSNQQHDRMRRTPYGLLCIR